MKKIAAITFFCCHFILLPMSSSKAQELEVIWNIGRVGNDSLEDLSFKLLQAISKDLIKAYDSETNEVLSKKYFDKKLKPIVNEEGLNKEEIAIMLHCGDYSFMHSIETKYSLEELKELATKYSLEDFVEFIKTNEIFELKEKKTFELHNLQIEINEKIELDTTFNFQRGNIEYLYLIIPKWYTSDKKKEVLCKISYEEFKNLNFIKEQTIIDERSFTISTLDSDILIIDKNNNNHRLSDLRTSDGRMVDVSKVNKSIFKYFTGQMEIKDPRVFR